MRIALLGFLASSSIALVGCMEPEPEVEVLLAAATTTSTTAQAVPTKSGKFIGNYTVPVTPDLASAATFNMAEVDWSVANGTATLHYELPNGLVGGVIAITYTGTIAPGATSVNVSGVNGTGTCTAASSSTVKCSENFTNLGTVPISMTAVQQQAVADGVSVQSRTAVANRFTTDPIGNITLDTTQPSPDVSGKDGSGSGKGGHSGRH